MAKILTRSLLEKAADLLDAELWDGGETYMCHAVSRAADGTSYANPVRSNFETLLIEHSVCTGGALENPWFDADPLSYRERQALRFDFLNLLAHSLES